MAASSACYPISLMGIDLNAVPLVMSGVLAEANQASRQPDQIDTRGKTLPRQYLADDSFKLSNSDARNMPSPWPTSGPTLHI
ncbi:uncharacterized protein RAG0_17159 [Rhynchosporium agropyri]|uniref:Uncharacterized protein n=1 Tax=Rhynchosporium agropyri TaxID=914238 RepID=A0A1E1LT40_9HELO|nr:uncharacterized protein RAG0_17159 [Rhynchosporium agropyri]